MLGQKHIYQDRDNYNSLKITPSGTDILYGRSQLIALMKKESKSEEKKSFKEVNYDENLFNKLKEVRTIIAKNKGLPPYIVFSDKTLKEMSSQRPDDETAMLRVSGVGMRKMEQYGSFFLKEIRTYLGYK